MKKNKLKAFTLLEMLVVIGIIAVLMGIGALSYSTAQKKARDTKRKQDLKALQNAMEQYYSVCNYQYPTSVSSAIICTSPSIAILPTESIPKDPKTGLTYTCNGCSSSQYQICTTFEVAPTQFCLKNQQ